MEKKAKNLKHKVPGQMPKYFAKIRKAIQSLYPMGRRP
jgi:hypothetical protein